MQRKCPKSLIYTKSIVEFVCNEKPKTWFTMKNNGLSKRRNRL